MKGKTIGLSVLGVIIVGTLVFGAYYLGKNAEIDKDISAPTQQIGETTTPTASPQTTSTNIIGNLTSSIEKTSSGIVYKNYKKGFTFTIPDSWDGNYVIQETDNATQVFYYEHHIVGFLFDIVPYSSSYGGTSIRTFDVGNTKYQITESGQPIPFLQTDDSHPWIGDAASLKPIRDKFNKMNSEKENVVKGVKPL